MIRYFNYSFFFFLKKMYLKKNLLRQKTNHNKEKHWLKYYNSYKINKKNTILDFFNNCKLVVK